MSSGGHPIWWLVTWAVVVWYSTITVYVAVRGARDVRGMLRRLGEGREGQDGGKG